MWFSWSVLPLFDRSGESADMGMVQVRTDFVPLAKLSAEQLIGVRNWRRGEPGWLRLVLSRSSPGRWWYDRQTEPAHEAGSALGIVGQWN
jgi:hypothetical protein